MSPTGESLDGQVLGGRYQLGVQLGSGADTEVYDATDLQLERQVAIKTVRAEGSGSPEFHRRFRELAGALAALSHPNILTVLDWGHEPIDGREVPYLVTEFVTGGSLADIIDRGRTLTPSQALLVGLDVCRGLDHAHRRGLVHGMMRPSGILFGADRRARVADIGLEVMIATFNQRTANDLDLAPARYLSPEQTRALVSGPKADVYSLALCLVESVTGRVPFGGDTTVATLTNRIDKLLPVSADLGPLASVLERAGRPLPAERASAAEFGRALVQTASKLPRPAPLPVAGGDTALFDAPPGQETTSELTRFRDSSGGLPREDGESTAPNGIARHRAPRDPTGGSTRPRVVALDETGEATRDEPRRPRGTVLAYLALVIGLVAASVLAVVAVRKLTEKSYDVPDLIGLEEGQARNEIANTDWAVVIRSERTDAQPQGRVFRTEPPPGATLLGGEEFVMYVSAGPPLVIVPEITGVTVEEAVTLLQSVNLSLLVTEQRYDETVPAGVIITWQVPAQPAITAGDEVVQGTTITAISSQGPAPREVPDLIGLTPEDAQQTVEPHALGIRVLDDPVFSSDVPAGSVVAQSLAPGTTTERGTIIELTLSKGPDLVSVPDVTFDTLSAATSALNDAGFAVGRVEGDPTVGRVIGVSFEGRQVAIGEQLPRNTALDLILI